MVTDSDVRIEDAFGHEAHCHTYGCPGVAFCANVAHLRDDAMTYHVGVDCGERECTCITAAIKKVVREERALTLDLAGEAIFGFSTKPQRGLRKLRQFARLVREGEA